MYLTRYAVACFTLLSAHAATAAPAIALHGSGVQIYTCAHAPTPAWTLKAPDAILTDARGKLAGHHFAGPSWQAADGSIVVGEVVASGAAPQPGSIPWVLLRAKSHTGAGAFADILYITRTQTEGGAAPAGGCDTAHLGGERRVPYNAIYTLFPAPPSV